MKTVITLSSLLLLPFLIFPLFAPAQGIEIQSGASITITGAATLEINNGGLINNGTFTKGSETFTLSGNTVGRSLSGSSSTEIHNLSITNTAGVTTQLGLLTLNNLTIGSGSSFKIDPNKFVTTTGTITNSAGNNGLVLKSTALGTASLKHGNNGVAANVERYIANDNAWHFLSSPVSAQAIWPDFTPSPSGSSFGVGGWNWDFFYFNPNAINGYPHLPWVNLRKTDGLYNDGGVDEAGDDAGFGAAIPTFMTARGYLAAYASDYGKTDFSFNGNLNSGSITIPVTYLSTNGWNLAGNPYPSAIDWKAGSGWDRSLLYGDDLSNGRDYWCWNESAGNYGTYNSIESDNEGTNGTSRYIAPAQGFFLLATASGDVTLNDNVRVHNSQSWLKNESAGDNVLRFRLTSENSTYSDEMAIKISPSYSNSGSFKFWSLYNEAPEIYCIIDETNYSVLRMPSVDVNSIIDLGIKAGITCTYHLTSSSLESFESEYVILEDLESGTFQNLRAIPTYSFSAIQGDNSTRFRLHFKNVTGVHENETETEFNVYYSNHTLCINPNGYSSEYTTTVSNLLGQVVYQKSFNSNTLNRIEFIQKPSVYLVTIESEGKRISKKIVVK